VAADPSQAAHQIVLVPGFFGFGRLGDLTYFNGVAAALERRFAASGVPVAVTEVTTLPTASIRVRAARVLETLAGVAALGEGPIHVIGHSTGGLDARLAIAPTASLPTDVEGFDYARVKTLVSVCCPHFGTPLATWFSGTFGKPILRLLALYWIWVLRRGRLPLSIALRLWYWVVRLRDPFRKRRGTFDEVYEKLLNNLTDERRAELIAFLQAVSTDQSLLFQLTPAGCDLLNACTADPELRYGSVVARSPGATFRRFLRSVRDLYPQIVYPIYSLLHALIARGENAFVPPPAPPQRERLLAAYGALPEPGDNDGMVPTNSQVWGEVIHAVSGDHLDLVGQFGFEDESGFSGDWLPSYAGFDRAQFEELWTRVADFLIDSVNQPPTDNVGTERTERDVTDPPH
jgi:pimeloyl-ACP methyl ester carboxylesterase